MANQVRQIGCPSCGVERDHRLQFVKNGCEILSCGCCGLGRTIAPAFDSQSYYTEAYFAGGHKDGYADYVGSESILRAEFARLLKEVTNSTGIREGRLLDVGCAYGFLLSEAADRFDVHGVEISGAAVDFCRSRGLHNVERGVISEQFFSRHGKFDLIFMLDVIEHLDHPAKVVELLASNLSEGGALVITTGDFSSSVAKFMGKGWRLMTPPQHLWFFTPDSMKMLAEHVGLHVQDLQHPWKTVPISLILFQLRRMLSLRSKHVSSYWSKFGVPVNLFDAMRVVVRRQ